MRDVILFIYFGALAILALYGAHVYYLVWWYHRARRRPRMVAAPVLFERAPRLTVQLPLYNEPAVAARLIDAVCRFGYPRDRLQVQVLDDSNDETATIAAERVAHWSKQGCDIAQIRRGDRVGYKAGALARGLESASGEFVAVFDADNLPPEDFPLMLLGEFADPRVALVQARWGHLNPGRSVLMRAQALYLDGHFLLEQQARQAAGGFINFNGTAGIWRKSAIADAGCWSAETLTEDLDLSYRAQLRGWKLVYRPDYVVPAELPPDARAFKSQQYRWAKGAVQTARRILPTLLRRPDIPARTKLLASFHLTAKFVAVLMLVMSAMLVPGLWIRWQGGWLKFVLWDVPLFVLATGSMSVFYHTVQRAAGGSTRGQWYRMPLLMSVGIGLSVTNARAFFSGLFSRAGEFVRTPKTGAVGDVAPVRQSLSRLQWSTPVEALFGLYSMTAFAIAIQNGLWMVVPFMLTFCFGFLYLAWLGSFALWRVNGR